MSELSIGSKLDKLRLDLAALLAAIEIAELEEAKAAEEEVEVAEEEEFNLIYGQDYNLWDDYYTRLKLAHRPIVPDLIIPEDAEIFDDWARLPDGTFAYLPAQDKKAEWLSGKGIRWGRMTKEQARRYRRYAAMHSEFFATTYLVFPAEFMPDEDYMNWAMLNWNVSQRTKLFINLGSNYINGQVFDEFDGMIPVPSSLRKGSVLISGGNLLDVGDGQETIQQSLQRGTDAFEAYWYRRDRKLQRNLINGAKWTLRRLDREYADLGDDEDHIAEFMARNPGYEPLED